MRARPGTETVDAPGGDDATAATVAIESAALGSLDVPETAVFAFPLGIPGFDACRRFALVRAGREGVYWLQSADDPGLAFVLADPFRLAADYVADVPDADTAPLGAGAPGDFLVLAIVTLPRAAGEPATANLRAPVVLNVATRRGRQVVLPDDRWGVAEVARI